MSLYGLDILIDREGKYSLSEINGVRSGMKGFREMYGDPRVEQQVLQMLQEKYGKLTKNDGTYTREKYKKEHPLKFALYQVFKHFPSLTRRKLPDILLSEHAFHYWWYEPLQYIGGGKNLFDKLEPYTGQDSVVDNVLNEELPHPTINTFVQEGITRNKFLQYELIKNTELKEHLPETILVGCGWIDKAGIEKILPNQTFFVKKPMSGEQGRGVRIINGKELQSYTTMEGPALYVQRPLLEQIIDLEIIFLSLCCAQTTPFQIEPLRTAKFLEEYAAENDFSFEPGMIIVQPFIHSTKKVDGQDLYMSIRSIVCNGQFVDAYARVSPDSISNLSRSAIAVPCEDHLPIAEFSEKVVRIYEQECAKYSPAFRKELYLPYFKEKGIRGSSRALDTLERVTMGLKMLR